MKNRFFLPAAQFAYNKGLGCADAQLTISHNIHKSLDIQGWSHIVQLGFSAAFDKVSLCGLLLNLMSIGVYRSVLSICREFLSNRRQRVVVDGSASEWILILSGVPKGSVLGPLLLILNTSEMFERVENWLYAYLPMLITQH